MVPEQVPDRMRASIETFRFLHWVFGGSSVVTGFCVAQWVDTGDGIWAGVAVATGLASLLVLVDLVLTAVEFYKARS